LRYLAPCAATVPGLRHIGINAVFLSPGMGGIETYVRRVMPELLAARPDLRFSLFLSRQGREVLSEEPWLDEVSVVTHPLLGVRFLSVLSEMTLLAGLAARRSVDLVDSVALTGPLHTRAAHVVTLGDMTWWREPASVEPITRWTWRTFVPRIARRADRILTYSQAQRDDIVELLGIAPERVDAVPLGPGAPEAANPVPEAELRRAHDLGDGPILLNVSVKRPSKNLGRLIEAIGAIGERVPGALLVLPGSPSHYDDELRALAERLGVAGRVRFPGHVSAGELEGLYRAAACFVFPSLYEGFGLPVLEAMRRGVPVACSTASAVPEVAGDAALYFDPRDVAQIAGAVVRVLEDPRLAERLAKAGRKRARGFSWRATAAGTLECFQRAWDARAVAATA
jgi:glycosyltransferase involved in cell wall biosynthesis